MNWKEALAANNGDYAYGPHGEMIERQENGRYSVKPGTLEMPGYTDLFRQDIAHALQSLNISQEEWSYE